MWKETLVAFLLTAAGAIVAYLLVKNNPSWYYILMPEGSAQGLMLAPSGGPAGFQAVLLDPPIREEQLAVFRESDGADWSDSDEG